MRIPFDIKYRPQIESGEYKVETRDGRKARIIHWDLNCTSPIVAVMDAHIDLPGEIADVFSVSGRAFDDLESPSDLFIVTPEEELTPFENRLCEILDFAINYQIHSTHEKTIEDAKKLAPELLAIAKKQLNIENLKDRAGDLTKHLNESGLDENSIEYDLIEFMCNLMDCPNWSEIVETAGLYAGRIKAEAVKDVPRWEFYRRGTEIDPLAVVRFKDGKIGRAKFAVDDCYVLEVEDMLKLPGFKED